MNKIRMRVMEDIYRNIKILYIEAQRTKFEIKDIIILLKEFKCQAVSFNNSLKIFELKDLEGKESWQDVKSK